ncbi:MAG: Gfo/Idh/MocA family oxidoreductase [Alphaproteobacteria bacterium]|nr:Gfo/Idh/MocA family oxidoreductase [Alphaproteobacteria bacterium]
MSKPKVRTGIVGAGFAASFHIEAARRVHGADVEVIGVQARTSESTEGFAAKHAIEAFTELDPLLDRVDVLHVCIPPALHEPVAVAALERGIYPIVEKPLTGYFGTGAADFDGRTASMTEARTGALASIERMRAAEAASRESSGPAFCTRKTGSMPRPSRRSGRSWKRPRDRSCGCMGRRPIPAPTLPAMAIGTRPAAAPCWARAAIL